MTEPDNQERSKRTGGRIQYGPLTLTTADCERIERSLARLLSRKLGTVVTIEDSPSFTCPRCGSKSYHPKDVAEGYCGHCHDWTGESQDA